MIQTLSMEISKRPLKTVVKIVLSLFTQCMSISRHTRCEFDKMLVLGDWGSSIKKETMLMSV